jgi:LuxR family maltose regulon positive regulatory protein
MTATAILDYFCAPLCDALQASEAAAGAGEMNGDEFIARLQKDNLFLVALDQENRWFRYHHLFRQLLQDRLNRHWHPEEIAALHSRAKAWLDENDIIRDAAVSQILAESKDNGYREIPDTIGIDRPSPQPPIFPAVRRSLQSEVGSSPSRPLVDPLTTREQEVLDLLAQRLSNQEIADKLFISITTVKSHIQNIYGKLNVNKRREAVEKAREIGIL